MQIDIDIKKAKEVMRDEWRKSRGPLLEKLDALYFKLIEDENTPKEILNAVSRHKQELRDVTEIDLSHINDLEELKSYKPECLKRSIRNV